MESRPDNALLSLIKALSVETNPIPVKTAASLLGLCSDEMRLPMVPLSGEGLQTVRCAIRGFARPEEYAGTEQRPQKG